MFWERFYSLCLENNTKPNPVTSKLGFSKQAATNWKNGSIPEGKNLQKIATFFDVSPAYLLGYSDDRAPAQGDKKSPTPEGAGVDLSKYSDEVLAAAAIIQELNSDNRQTVIDLAQALKKRQSS